MLHLVAATLLVTAAAAPAETAKPESPAKAPEPAPRMMVTQQSQMPRTGQETLTQRVPLYPNAKTPPVRVGDELHAHGMPMFVQSFYTDDDPHKVLDWYKNFFDGWGLAIMGDGDFSQMFQNPSITVFDDINGVDIHVICAPGDQNGKTMVMLAMADIATFEQNLDRAEAQKWAGLPPYAGAEPTAMTSTDGEVHTTTVSFTTPDAPEKILGFYKKLFAGSTYKEVAEEAGQGQVSYRDARGTWRLSVRGNVAPGQSGFFATWTDRGMAEGGP